MSSILIVHNYFGPRRVLLSQYTVDSLFFAKKQIEYLANIKHEIDHIVFTVNRRDEMDDQLIHNLSLMLPSRLQKATTEIIVRENIGLSYGAFSDVYKKYRTKYSHYFFTEDDYLFCEDDFDSTLISMLMENPRPGYLCGLLRNIEPFGLHAGNSVGVASAIALEDVFSENESIPHVTERTEDPYEPDLIPSQVLHTNSIHKKGYSLTDIGSRYTLYHVWPEGYEHHFQNNEKEIIKPVQRTL